MYFIVLLLWGEGWPTQARFWLEWGLPAAPLSLIFSVTVSSNEAQRILI